MSFGKLLVQLRTEKGIYQKELADYLNVSIGTISNYENDVHSPDLPTLKMLADYFEVTTDFLLERTAYRHSLDTLNAQITMDYTVSDFINTTLELSARNRNCLIDYLSLLLLRNDESTKADNKKNKPQRTTLPKRK